MLLRPFKSRNCGRTLMTFADSPDAEIANARTIKTMKICQRTARTLVARFMDDNWVVSISIRTSAERDCAESQSQQGNGLGTLKKFELHATGTVLLETV